MFTFFRHFLSSSANSGGWIRTLDLRMRILVFYHFDTLPPPPSRSYKASYFTIIPFMIKNFTIVIKTLLV